jgi:rubrerythrin
MSLLALKGEKWACPFCGGKVQAMASRNRPSLSKRLLPQPRTRSGGRTWRCEKYGHVLNKKRKHCPIDGSPAGWVVD